MSVETLTFGCRLNAYESEVMKAEAEKAGLTDVLVVNTCAVTGEAVRQAKQAIRKARRDHPTRKIIVTGCAAQTDARSFGDMAEVDLVIGNADKLKAESYAPMAFGVPLNDKVQVNDIMSVRETAGHMIDAMDGRARAFVQVQNGCDHRCTFCIIPFGFREIVLTGVDITSYGPDLPGQPSLGKLVQSILRHVPELPRLRISSIDSIEADEALYDAIATDHRLMPHLHLSMQSGDDMILKRMKRRHLRADTLAFVDKVRALRPDFVFGADIIAGFPTEDDAMFENTLRMVEEAGLTYLHVFPYSPRPGTPAARMPQVDKALAKARARLLREAGDRQLEKLRQSRIGMLESVLVEGDGIGRTEQFVPVELAGHAQGEIVTARIVGMAGDRLVGEPIRSAA
jgi:threonylcarbamoyladenosine tRNA methylthiotransferase MtaB